MKKSQQNKMALFGKEQMEKYTRGALKPWTVPFTIYGCLYMLGYLCSKGYSNVLKHYTPTKTISQVVSFLN